MRHLILLRHAKSSWDHPGLADIERPLNKRGQRDAPIMGQRLRERNLQINRIVSSPAVRALTTARTIAAELGYADTAIRKRQDLYLASPRSIVNCLVDEAEDCATVILVGHNPGMTELANLLSDARIDNIPTCGMFAVDFDCNSWEEILRHPGRFAWFDYPKNVS